LTGSRLGFGRCGGGLGRRRSIAAQGGVGGFLGGVAVHLPGVCGDAAVRGIQYRSEGLDPLFHQGYIPVRGGVNGGNDTVYFVLKFRQYTLRSGTAAEIGLKIDKRKTANQKTGGGKNYR
jgi:hypothetical protein